MAIVSDRFRKMETVLKRNLRMLASRMSLPFTRNNETYRTCVKLRCSPPFQSEQWTTVGGSYYPQRQGLSIN